MKTFKKPNIVLSKCINLAATRYDGGLIKSEFAELLGRFVNYMPVCPEVSIGLPIPRDPIIIVKDKEDVLFQLKSGRILTKEMEEFSKNFFDSLKDIDGFLFKSKSPSCGVKDTNLYSDYEGKNIVGKTSGMFARVAMEKFPDYPIEDEKRLIDKSIRELYLTKIFAFADIRELRNNLTKSNLIQFHSDYKLLLMTYNQKNLRLLGRLISNLKEENIDEIYENYTKIFRGSFKKKPSRGSHVNTLLHAFGYFKYKISTKEKAHFLDVLETFSKGRVDIYTPREMIINFAIRFDEEYLLNQRYFMPYPKELSEV